MAAAFKDKDRLRYQEFLQVIDGKTTGAARASLGLATTFADVYWFWEFAARLPRHPFRGGRGLSCRPVRRVSPGAPAAQLRRVGAVGCRAFRFGPREAGPASS